MTESESAQSEPTLERGTYEIILNRLNSHADDLRTRLGQLNEERRDVFGSIATELISNQRITTDHNCTPRDIVPVGDRFIFGYNVHMGLKTRTELSDVFSVFEFSDRSMHAQPLDLLKNGTFEDEFFALYKYYKGTQFAKFHVIGPHLYLVFRVGKSATDTKSFKFLIDGASLRYIDNRSDHEVVFPDQHDFEWAATTREQHRDGMHPHISIHDRVFVETVGGDLTIKVEDNTDDGSGSYAEHVDEPDQTLDDADIFYSIVGNLILMKIRPFKEEAFRYLVFNEKTRTVTRVDSIANACVLLPEDHGLIFSNGYYLQTGQYKTFENDLTDLLFERRIASVNGEAYLYVFYNRETGHHVLLSYNMIEQAVATPIVCNGFSIFDNGHLIYYKSDPEPAKHHAIQIWQTPYVSSETNSGQQADSFLYKIGNREIVRAMAESHEILNLIDQDDSYANLYVDLVKRSTDMLDSYFWLSDQRAFQLSEPLGSIREAATAAIDEFDKVVRVRQNTRQQFDQAAKATRESLRSANSKRYDNIDDYVVALSSLRTVRGQVISLKELKYVDLDAVEQLESQVAEASDKLSQRCVDFLLTDSALEPYVDRVHGQRDQIDSLGTAVEAKSLDEQLVESATQLEMLIEIVSNLKIDDATQRTRIIDNISTIYADLNQTRAALKKQSQALMSVEGKAEFNSQLKLISQAVVNYLDVCDSPAKCDEYLTRMMVQVEELEGKFAEFDEFIVQLAEKREEIYGAFDAKKLQLGEARNRRATALMSAAERILGGIRSRVSGYDSIDQINSYFASDLMIDKIRDIVTSLDELEESVKVDDVQSRLKTIQEDAVRQLKDRNELYVDGQNVIQFGSHKFSVNTQPLELTNVIKDGQMFFHLSGTNFFEPVKDPTLESTRDLWDQHLVSENEDVYRAEYLAYLMLLESRREANGSQERKTSEELLAAVQKFMSARYTEGYIKGVHDHDAALILQKLLQLDSQLGFLKFSPSTRSLAAIYWCSFDNVEQRNALEAKLQSLGAAADLFGPLADRQQYIDQLAEGVAAKCTNCANVKAVAEYLFEQVGARKPFVRTSAATKLANEFTRYVDLKRANDQFQLGASREAMSLLDRFEVTCDWVSAYVDQEGETGNKRYVDEAAAILVGALPSEGVAVDIESVTSIEGLLGDHARVDDKRYTLDFNEFMVRLDEFRSNTVPRYESYVHAKKEVLDRRRDSLRLDEFKPRVLTSFVRNQLINDTYLPIVGANLAKQIGVIGEDKRTDLMGMLLLISPPGYGKTTLMEYVANRLGITFMKINGPAIGHQVTSLDPAEAPNASSREEIEKLNLALKMGDNVMIYVDDIQHCNPEFLQKFISLCDATRRIEGVFGGRTRTYDLRGRKVAVVMAGNPYTESGEKFQIPDMLASRADTYNLGDVIGGSADSFELSYLENCLTSNSTLGRLASRSQKDVYSVIKMAQSDNPGGISLEGNYSIEEINELVAVMKKLIVARDVVLPVNRQYIDSAAQADEYRTEPAFKLQGSYRDMNKIAEQVAPIVNDEELQTIINSHYQNQAQTLTSGAEANLLKLKELMGILEGDDAQRWRDIKSTFERNLLLGSVDGDNQLGQIVAQMSTFTSGLGDIKRTLDAGVDRLAESKQGADSNLEETTVKQVAEAVAELSDLNETISKIASEFRNLQPVNSSATAHATAPIEKHQIEVINKVPNIFLDIIRNQFRVLQTWMEPILKLSEVFAEAEDLKKAAKLTEANYEQLLDKIQRPEREIESE